MLWDPPSRSSLWRFGYGTPVNYDDNQLYCGGFDGETDGKFKRGICGDSFDDPMPRDNEDGGTYGLGIITRSTISVSVNLDTGHKGYFVFHICNLDKSPETEDCFRKLFCEGGLTRYYVSGSRFYNISLQLPRNMRCDHCVLRWHYRTGNSWGICDDGTEALGCGPQETFRNCADISINNTNFKKKFTERVFLRTKDLQRLRMPCSIQKLTELSKYCNDLPSFLPNYKPWVFNE